KSRVFHLDTGLSVVGIFVTFFVYLIVINWFSHYGHAVNTPFGKLVVYSHNIHVSSVSVITIINRFDALSILSQISVDNSPEFGKIVRH
ncbi:hypothetical protein, partial [Bacillus licheniformis]|uniref:hypothetical protein n=1 Tax=Bacillus licheniformis TaxID=1402 RepID=UPI001F404612